jgi:hypothetical protein
VAAGAVASPPKSDRYGGSWSPFLERMNTILMNEEEREERGTEEEKVQREK